jgi:5-hydroxyisourate hydrolase-like protein (transthyretin family)
MRSLRLSVAALLAMGAAGGFAATAASASTKTPVMFSGVTVAPSTISYGDNTVTVTGQLVDYQDRAVGVPDEQVSLEYNSNGAALDTVTTDANGDFTATATLSEGATLRMGTDGDGTYGAAISNSFTISTSPEAPTVTLDPRPSLVWAGNALTFTGKATVSVNGTAQPLAGVPVELYRDGEDAGVSVTTAADGTFSLPAAPTAGGQWTAEVSPTTAENLSLYGQGISNAVTVNVQHLTRIENVSLPATAEVHGAENIKETVQESDAASWIPADGVMVSLYARNSSTGAWVSVGEAQTNSAGAFTANLGLKVGTKQVQARVLQQAMGDVYKASSGPISTIKMYDQTIFRSGSESVAHFDGRTEVDGMIVDWWGSGNTDRSFETVTGTAKVYYRPNTSTAWKYLGSTKLGQGGSADYTYYGTLHGYFYIQYPAQGYFLASKSSTLHIS